MLHCSAGKEPQMNTDLGFGDLTAKIAKVEAAGAARWRGGEEVAQASCL